VKIFKKQTNIVKKETSFEEVVRRLDDRFSKWYRIMWYGMLQGAGAVLGAILLVLILALILETLGLTELSETIKLYGRYGRI